MYSIYARTNNQGVVIHLFSNCFETPKEGDILIKSGQGDEFVHNYIDNLYGGGYRFIYL